MTPLSPDAWRPEGVASLEPIAEAVVREARRNTLVLAGPGAGKTELLAQKASFLLKTHMCPYPQRILAISFKRDAARNLRDRVELRCGRELASRLDSLTFDAFSKSLLDRFRLGLAELWRPTFDYEIDFSLQKKPAMRELLDAIPPRCGLSLADMQSLSEGQFERQWLCREQLPLFVNGEREVGRLAASACWRFLLHEQDSSRLTFGMISRLAELVLRSNPLLLVALRQTYSFVFLDEFQDTTQLQYDLTCACFGGTGASMTAVGDGNQRIMLWAGALDGVFEEFSNDFRAEVKRLRRNYRSAARLVRAQHTIALALDGQTAEAECMDSGAEGDGEIRVLSFASHEREATHLAGLVAGWLNWDGLRPRDICVITRQLPDKYSECLRAALGEAGVSSRVESDMQDLLAEPITTLLVDMLRLLFCSRSPAAWKRTTDLLLRICGGDTEQASRRVEDDMAQFLRQGRAEYASPPWNVREIVNRIIEYVGREGVISVHPQYEQGRYLDDLVTSVVNNLDACLRGSTWSQAIDIFEGVTSVPIMSIHKSKGLEYHTVVFVGLEDSALWGYSRDPQEETCAFFVALSRAKKRVIFTTCDSRPGRWGRPETQSIDTIRPLYDLLDHAGISVEQIGVSEDPGTQQSPGLAW